MAAAATNASAIESQPIGLDSAVIGDDAVLRLADA
jgi:hypothetical protein